LSIQQNITEGKIPRNTKFWARINQIVP